MNAEPVLKTLKLQGPLLEIGIKDTEVYVTDSMWVHLKIYADSGENDLHAHPLEEHSFLVLDGQATFFGKDASKPMVVNQYEGILVPKGAVYRFRNTGNHNLVMLRIGTGSNARLPGKQDERVDPKGEPMPFNPSLVKKGHNIPVPVAGKFWPADRQG